MASVYDDIRSALETRLKNTVGIPSSVAFENIKFSPVTKTPFIKTGFVPISRRPANRGANPTVRYDGLFQIVLYCSEATGPALADDYANLIIESFDHNTDLSFTNSLSQTIYVSCAFAERTQGIEESPWYKLPVTISWYCYY